MDANNSGNDLELLRQIYFPFRLEADRTIDESFARNAALQMAALFTWDEMPWPNRITALREIWSLKQRFNCFDWIGIYVCQEDRSSLKVSAYIGEPTEHIFIPIDRGICGAAIREDKTLNIPDVRADSRFIACSIKTRSELVVPIRNRFGQPVAEIDIDSNQMDAFTPEIAAAVEAAASKLSRLWE